MLLFWLYQFSITDICLWSWSVLYILQCWLVYNPLILWVRKLSQYPSNMTIYKSIKFLERMEERLRYSIESVWSTFSKSIDSIDVRINTINSRISATLESQLRQGLKDLDLKVDLQFWVKVGLQFRGIEVVLLVVRGLQGLEVIQGIEVVLQVVRGLVMAMVVGGIPITPWLWMWQWQVDYGQWMQSITMLRCYCYVIYLL